MSIYVVLGSPLGSVKRVQENLWAKLTNCPESLEYPIIFVQIQSDIYIGLISQRISKISYRRIICNWTTVVRQPMGI
jgi:hypothetical protein